MREAGIDALGMHLEVVTPQVRQRIMPGKAQVSVERYFEAFAAAVPVFGRGQVSTYILAGLGDPPERDSHQLPQLGPARAAPDLRRHPMRPGRRMNPIDSTTAERITIELNLPPGGPLSGMAASARVMASR